MLPAYHRNTNAPYCTSSSSSIIIHCHVIAVYHSELFEHEICVHVCACRFIRPSIQVVSGNGIVIVDRKERRNNNNNNSTTDQTPTNHHSAPPTRKNPTSRRGDSTQAKHMWINGSIDFVSYYPQRVSGTTTNALGGTNTNKK